MCRFQTSLAAVAFLELCGFQQFRDVDASALRQAYFNGAIGLDCV
jgi:hypothetical protein